MLFYIKGPKGPERLILTIKPYEAVILNARDELIWDIALMIDDAAERVEPVLPHVLAEQILSLVEAAEQEPND